MNNEGQIHSSTTNNMGQMHYPIFNIGWIHHLIHPTLKWPKFTVGRIHQYPYI